MCGSYFLPSLGPVSYKITPPTWHAHAKKLHCSSLLHAYVATIFRVTIEYIRQRQNHNSIGKMHMLYNIVMAGSNLPPIRTSDINKLMIFLYSAPSSTNGRRPCIWFESSYVPRLQDDEYIRELATQQQHAIYTDVTNPTSNSI